MFGMRHGLVEMVLWIALVVLMVRVASLDNLSPWLWGAVTLGIVWLCLAIPFPYARVVIAGVAVIAAMTGYKMIRRQ